jgi:putative endonuclease
MRETVLSQSYFVYIVRCANSTLYTGYTTDVARRVAAHNSGRGSKYTRYNRPVILQAAWVFGSRADAMRVERAIKRLPRERKLGLITAYRTAE